MTDMEKRYFELITLNASETSMEVQVDKYVYGKRMYLLALFHASTYFVTDPDCKYRIKALARRFDMAAAL